MRLLVNVHQMAGHWLLVLMSLSVGAIINSIRKFQPSGGISTIFGTTTSNQASLNAGNNPINSGIAVLNATTSFIFSAANGAFGSNTPTIQQGLLRIKATSAGSGTGTISSLKITVTDGTSTNVIFFQSAGWTAGDLPDFIVEFFSDLAITSITVAVACANTANGSYTMDMELSGTM